MLDPVRKERVERLLKAGRYIAAHHEMKQLAEGKLDNPDVLALLTQTARKVKAWGEALAVAQLRVRVAPTPAAYIELAKLERATLQGDPLATVRKALDLDPDNSRARELLSDYEKQEKLAHR